jgi:capsular polysaccharide biosynthesis protein
MIVVYMNVPSQFVGESSVGMVADVAGGNAAATNVVSTETSPFVITDLSSIATSATVLDRFRKSIGSHLRLDKLKKKIKAKVPLNSNIMYIDYVGDSEQSAIDGANALAEDTTKFYRQIASSRFDSLISDLSAQMQSRSDALHRLDVQLQTLAAVYPYVDTKDDIQSVYDRLIKLATERTDAAAAAAADKAQLHISNALVAAAKPVGVRDVVTTDPVYHSQEINYARDASRLSFSQASESDRFPGVRELQSIVSHEKAGVALARAGAQAAGPGGNLTYENAKEEVIKVDAQRAADAARLGSLEHDLAALKAQTVDPATALRAAQLRRNREALQDAYSILVTRYAQALADRSQAASTGSLVVVDRAIEAKPNLDLVGIVALSAIAIITLWAAISLAYLLDSRDPRFVDSETVESMYGMPVVTFSRA